jgi:hypothetical protein
MPKLATPRADIPPRTAKPKDKWHKLSGRGGLQLLMNPDRPKY